MSNASVAPTERVNIVYKSTTGDSSEEVELPLKLLVLGDLTGKLNGEALENRTTVNINKDNFNDVMSGFNLSLAMTVGGSLTEDREEMSVHLKIKSLKDLSPDSVARQVPELNDMIEMRKALLALKGPLGNVPAFRKTIQGILNEDDLRTQMMKELGLEN
jgi:type VI secretion system protein ImpB